MYIYIFIFYPTSCDSNLFRWGVPQIPPYAFIPDRHRYNLLKNPPSWVRNVIEFEFTQFLRGFETHEQIWCPLVERAWPPVAWVRHPNRFAPLHALQDDARVGEWLASGVPGMMKMQEGWSVVCAMIFPITRLERSWETDDFRNAISWTLMSCHLNRFIKYSHIWFEKMRKNVAVCSDLRKIKGPLHMIRCCRACLATLLA